MTRAPAPLIALAALAGCAASPSVGRPAADAPPPAAAGRCDASGVQRLLGTVPTAALIEAARRKSGAAMVRTIPPGTMVTMDYRPDRLNLTLDGAGKLVALRCG